MAAAPVPVAELVPFAEYGEAILASQVFDPAAAESAPGWLDAYLGEVTQVPKGRKGLWGALASCSVADRSERSDWSDPVDTSALGPVARPMFEVDLLTSIDLSLA